MSGVETARVRVGVGYAVVDVADLAMVQGHRWRPLVRRNTTYAATTIRISGVRVVVRMHRMILGLTDPRVLCDHVDRNGLNNSRSNLRVANTMLNAGNSSGWARRLSRYKGLTFHPASGKWQVRCAGKYVGLYESEAAAGAAYNDAAVRVFGEFARLNALAAS